MDKDFDKPQGETAYWRLLEEIRLGTLKPGDRLREIELAERFQVSRTPVREAIRRLETDGLVAHQARQGATVRRLSYAETVELYEMRAVLESTAARLAARAASDVELSELETLNAEFAASSDEREAYELNRQFHFMLLDAAKNRFLIKASDALRKTMLILGSTTLMEPERVRQAADEHSRLIGFLRARDGAGAENAMRHHIEQAQRVRLTIIRQAERPLHDD